jgi:hypothetical protein
MSDFERSQTPDYTRLQLDVFGTVRMAMLAGHEATPDSTEELLRTIGTIAVEPGSKEHHGIMSRSLQRAVGRPLVAQVNPNGKRGFGSTEEDVALATVYGLKNEERHVVIPRRWLSIGVYEVDETIYVGADHTARIFKRFTPLYGNLVREITANVATPISARKLATEAEVQEALGIITDAVRYDDWLRATPSND